MMDYRTVAREAQAEFTEKRSRFLAYVCPVSTEQQALDFIEQIRKKHWDARHNVFAYRLHNGCARCSDDGEPQSTAGAPTMEVLTGADVTDLVVVVTRYFGGVLLGTGGLVRAYSTAARLGLEAAGTVTMTYGSYFTLSCDYFLYNTVAALISAEGKITDSAFETQVILQFFLPQQRQQPFLRALADKTAGCVCATKLKDGFLPF